MYWFTHSSTGEIDPDKIDPDRLTVSEFLRVYYFLSKRSLPARHRRETLIEYRFKYDPESKEWFGSKESVYNQLVRNFHINTDYCTDFDSLLRHAQFGGKTNSAVLPRSQKKIEPLLYEDNPYIKKSADNLDSDRKVEHNMKEVSDRSNSSSISHEMDQIIITKSMPDKEIAEKLGISTQSVRDRRFRLKSKLAQKHDHPKTRTRYTYEDDKLILFSHHSQREIAEKINHPLDSVKTRKRYLSTLGVVTEKDLKGLHHIEEDSDELKVDEKTLDVNKETGSRNKNVDTDTSSSKISTNEDCSEQSTGKVNGLVDRTMDLLTDLESLAKELENKKEQIRTKSRYEVLLRTLIDKDLQFFALTAGDDKVQAQNKYLKSIGFTEKEVNHFRNCTD